MSKERARRRAEREREAAIKAAARAAAAERRERRDARLAGVRRAAGRLPALRPVGRDTGVLARRRRVRRGLLVVTLVALNVLVWVVRPDWEARLAAFVVGVLAFPVLLTLTQPRR